jgi:hypothetical protein
MRTVDAGTLQTMCTEPHASNGMKEEKRGDMKNLQKRNVGALEYETDVTWSI